jgi:hypothetical protein
MSRNKTTTSSYQYQIVTSNKNPYDFEIGDNLPTGVDFSLQPL